MISAETVGKAQSAFYGPYRVVDLFLKNHGTLYNRKGVKTAMILHPGAQAIGLGDQIGTIEKGKLADDIIVDGDPLEDMRVLQQEQKIKMVMKEGRIVITR